MNQSTTPARRTLLDISDDMVALDDLLMECGGDITDPAVAATIDQFIAELSTDLKGKADAYAHLITELTLRSKVRAEAAKQMKALADVDERAAASLKARILLVLEANGIKKLETDRHRFTVAKNGGVQPMEIDNIPADQMPPQYTIVKVEANNEKIRAALVEQEKARQDARAAFEAGDIIEPELDEMLASIPTLTFARLKERGTHLLVK